MTSHFHGEKLRHVSHALTGRAEVNTMALPPRSFCEPFCRLASNNCRLCCLGRSSHARRKSAVCSKI